MPAAPLVPSESSASKANAIEPSSKPGNDEGDAGGSADSRRGGGGGGSQLGLDDEAFGGGEETALARAAAPVPWGGWGGGDVADDVTAGGAADADAPPAEGGELAKATVARCCALLLARPGSGADLPAAEAGAPAAEAAAAAAAAAFAETISSGVTAGMRVESMRTAAISVEPPVESEYRPGDAGDAGLLLWGSSPSGFSPGAREPDGELMRVASPGRLLSLAYPRAILGLHDGA